MSRCTSVRVNSGNKNKEGIVIKSIPGNHQALHTFCKLAQKTGHKLFYAGDSAGVVAYRFMQMLTVRKREAIPEDITAALMEHQSNRCGACGDLLRKFEKHHKKQLLQAARTTSTIWCSCAQLVTLRKPESRNRPSVATMCGSSHVCPRACTTHSRHFHSRKKYIGAKKRLSARVTLAS